MVALDWKKATLPLTNLIRPNWLKKLPTMASFFLLVAIAYSLAVLTWMVLPEPEQVRFIDPNKASGTVRAVSTNQSGTTPIPDIARLHLFGEVSKVVDLPPQQEVVPETKLKLELKGIWASSDSKQARAIISEPPRNENTYAVGASLPGGATLVEIHADHIVLSRQGRKEKLLLPRESMQSGQASSRSTSRQTSSRRNTTTRRSTSNSRNTVSSRAAAAASSISRLSELRESISKDPQSLMGLIDATPEFKNGQITGYKLNNMQNEQLLRRFGLRRGDVITSVNDIRLDATANLPNLLNILKTAEEVKIEYNRRGRPRSVVLNMNE